MVVSLISGIVVADFMMDAPQHSLDALFISFTAIGFVFLLLFLFKRNKLSSPLFGLGAMLLLVAAGMELYRLDAEAARCEWPEEKCYYRAVLTDVPQTREKSVFCPAKVELAGDSSGRCVQGTVYLYFAYSYWANELKIGDKVYFAGKVRPPENRGNPCEFDYERYLYIKGVSGTAYLPRAQWRKMGNEPLGLRARALALRAELLRKYVEWGFTGDRLSVLSALSLGYKGGLSDEVKEEYSVAGASHILALSGLHIGILYGLLVILIPRFTKRRRSLYLVCRSLAIAAIIWAFAFVVGLSPSVVRASILFTMMALASTFDRESMSLNSMALAAGLMLLCSPRSLFDVSFQLSFAAVLSIVLLQPSLNRLLPVQRSNRVVRYLWDIVTVSVAAQVGTAPLVIYYFSNFPLYFLLTNLLVIPLAFVILVLVIVLWLVCWVSPLRVALVWLISAVIDSLNLFMDWVSSLPYASLQLFDTGPCEVVVLYSLFIFTALWLIKKWNRGAVLALSCTALLLLASIYSLLPLRQTPYLLFFNSNKCPAAQMVCSMDQSYLLSTMQDSVMEQLEYVARPYWNVKGMDEPLLLPDVYYDDKITAHCGITAFEGRLVCLLDDASWLHLKRDEPFCVDYMFVCKGFKGRLTQVVSAVLPKVVVLDASLGTIRLRSLKSDCDKLKLRYVDLSKDGAFKIDL